MEITAENKATISSLIQMTTTVIVGSYVGYTVIKSTENAPKMSSFGIAAAAATVSANLSYGAPLLGIPLLVVCKTLNSSS